MIGKYAMYHMTTHMLTVIGASLSEPHIVVISITYSCPASYAYIRICIRLTFVDPIAYNRISMWKTGILRILLKLCRATCARPRSGQPIALGLRANGDTPCSVHERCPSIYAG